MPQADIAPLLWVGVGKYSRAQPMSQLGQKQTNPPGAKHHRCRYGPKADKNRLSAFVR